MKRIKIIAIMLLGLNWTLQAQHADCSSYLAEQLAGTDVCANQPFLLQVPLDVCPGTVDFSVDINTDDFPGETTWQITDGSGVIVASGGPLTVANGTESLGPFSFPAAAGPYTFTIFDAFGDGILAPGGVDIFDDNNGGATLYTTTCCANGGLDQDYDLSPAVINPLTTVTVNWYVNGAISTTQANVACNNFFNQFTLATTNICQPEAQTIGFDIVCDVDGFVLASNTAIAVNVFPPVAPAVTDLVSITYPNDPGGNGCDAPTITYLNDCTSAEVSVVEDVAPAACGAGATTDGDADFTVTYLGPVGGPDCCATGGPLVPVQDTGDNTDIVTDLGPQDQFGGTNNAHGYSYATVTPGCGAATIGNLTFNVCGVTHPTATLDPPPTGADPTVNGEENYFVTIYVNGAIVFDGDLDIGGAFGDWNYCADNVIDLAALGFDGNSTVEVYVYPNQIAPAEYPTDWDATISIDVDVTYAICMVASPVNCALPLTVPYSCACGAAPVCDIVTAVSNVVCDDAGTPADPADDTFTFDVDVTQLDATFTTFSSDGGDAGVAYGGGPITYGPYPISGGDITITYTDDTDGTCTEMAVGVAPAPCSGCAADAGNWCPPGP